ncbi:unnamed protein product [Symbiodinium sp. KB8]|nr:unnamed protein product [Symbiodinium sp. KB8]
MALHPGARTTTWDRPPLGLARTETLLESARVSPAAPEVRPLPENRADSSGWTPSPHPAVTQVPPTTLRELQPIPLTRTVATGPSQLQRLGTWSQAPEALAAPWPRMMAPPQRLGATALPPAVPAQLQRASTTTGGHPVPLQRASTVTGARAPVLSRACTLTLPSPPALSVPTTQQAQAIVLQRTGTVTLAESTPGLTAQPAQLPAQPLQRAGTVTMPETAGTSASAAPVRVLSPAPVTSIVSQATSACSVRRMPTKEDLPEVGRLLFQSMLGRLEAPEEEPPRQLRLVIGGLMGSGKSTICRMLRHLLKGTWINQDEFSSQKNAKKAFLKAIAEAAADDAVAVLLVDKINTERQHRSGIVQEMRKGRPGDIVYVQIKHPDDATDRWENTLSWCESRIARRGSGHRTLMADNPQLRSILQRTAQAAEPLSKEEARNFAATLRVNMVQTSIVQVMKLLQDLDEVGLLEPRFELASLLQEHRLLQAQDAANRAEWELAAAASKGKGKGQKDESPKGPPPVWYWVVQLDEVSSELLLKRWEQQEDYDTAVASGISVAKEHHVTLLYLGGGKDEEVATRNPKLEGPAHVAQLREEFKRRAGEKVDLDVTSIVWEEGRIAAASVALRGGIDQLCANVHPHITLGTAARVNAVKSNEVLARRAATLDLQSGLQAWLQQLSLAQYTERLAAWCLQMGAASPEELAEFASDAAAAIETDDPEAQARVAEVLKSAVERPLQELRLANPLQLTGVIHGPDEGMGNRLHRKVHDAGVVGALLARGLARTMGFAKFRYAALPKFLDATGANICQDVGAECLVPVHLRSVMWSELWSQSAGSCLHVLRIPETALLSAERRHMESKKLCISNMAELRCHLLEDEHRSRFGVCVCPGWAKAVTVDKRLLRAVTSISVNDKDLIVRKVAEEGCWSTILQVTDLDIPLATANGTYLATAAEYQGDMVYQNSKGFLVSCEHHEDTWQGWILGLAGHPLYVAESMPAAHQEVPGSWRVVPTWGKDPAPSVTAVFTAAEATLLQLQKALASAEDAAATGNFDDAQALLDAAQDDAEHLLDHADNSGVAPALQRLQCLRESLPWRRASALRSQGVDASDAEDWDGARRLFETALRHIDSCESQESGNLRQELRKLLAQCPERIVMSRLREAEKACDAQQWRDCTSLLESVQQHAKEAAAAGACTASLWEEQAKHLRLRSVLGQAKELQCRGDEARGSTRASYESAATCFVAALELLEPLQGTGGPASALLVELKEAMEGLAVLAMGQVEAALGEESLEAGIDMDGLLSFADRVLRHVKGSQVLRVELEALQEATAQAKISDLRTSGDAAVERGDWQEADACWAAALQLIAESQVLPVVRLREELTTARRFAAVTMAGSFLKQGDASRESGDVFSADRLYSDALGVLPAEDSAVAPLRCGLLLKRAEVLHQKWQHKDALDDCVAVLNLGLERPRALHIAAEACRALYLREAEDPELEGNVRSHWMDMAVHYLEEASATSEDPALQRRLRAWRREVPPRPTPVPMPPFDWSTVPKNEKANYFGCVDRRAGFSEAKLQHIWEALRKESNGTHAASISKATFVRALRHFSGDIEEDEAEALFHEANRDQDGLLTFDDFQKIMQMDAAKP